MLKPFGNVMSSDFPEILHSTRFKGFVEKCTPSHSSTLRALFPSSCLRTKKGTQGKRMMIPEQEGCFAVVPELMCFSDWTGVAGEAKSIICSLLFYIATLPAAEGHCKLHSTKKSKVMVRVAKSFAYAICPYPNMPVFQSLCQIIVCLSLFLIHSLSAGKAHVIELTYTHRHVCIMCILYILCILCIVLKVFILCIQCVLCKLCVLCILYLLCTPCMHIMHTVYTRHILCILCILRILDIVCITCILFILYIL